MRVLVTGGAGYIGSVTTRALYDAGHVCTVLDSLERGHAEAVDPRARFVRGDIGDAEAVADALQDCDAVLHFAGLIEVAESQQRPEAYWEANAAKPRVLVDAALEAQVAAFVFSSTAAVYGEPEQVPITEDALTRPVNVYGSTKLAFERAVEDATRRGLPAIRFRYFNVAGALPDGSVGEAHEPETHIVPRVLGAMRDGQDRFEVFGGDYPTCDGTCVRDYIHVADLADAHVRGIEYLAEGGEGGVFNLGNGRGFTNRQVVEACAEVTGATVAVEIGPRRNGDPAMLVAASERARELLGWRPRRTEIGEIAEDAWRWHLAHPNGYR